MKTVFGVYRMKKGSPHRKNRVVVVCSILDKKDNFWWVVARGLAVRSANEDRPRGLGFSVAKGRAEKALKHGQVWERFYLWPIRRPEVLQTVSNLEGIEFPITYKGYTLPRWLWPHEKDVVDNLAPEQQACESSC